MVEMGADVVAHDALAGFDELDFGAEGHRMVGQQWCQRLVDGVHQPGEKPLNSCRLPARSDASGEIHEPVGRVAVGNAVVLAGNGPGAQCIKSRQAVVKGRGMDGRDQFSDVGQLCEIGGVFDDDVRHGQSNPPRLYGSTLTTDPPRL